MKTGAQVVKTNDFLGLILLHSEWPKLHRVLAILSAVGLRDIVFISTFMEDALFC